MVELDETFSVLLNSSNEFVDVTQASTNVTITDDDTVRIGWNPTLYTVDEPDGAVSVCVEITGGEIARPITAFYSTADGTALGKSKAKLLSWLVSLCFSCVGQHDFTTASNMVVSFQLSSANERQCVEIQIEDDSILESTETFQVILNTTDRAVEIDFSTATINILDNDRKIKKLCGIISSRTDYYSIHVDRSSNWIQ